MVGGCGHDQKVCVLLHFSSDYGASPQVLAMVLFAALSLHLQHRPYQDEAHNYLESLGLHVCLLQLLVTLMSNMIGRVDRNVSNSPLGLQSTIIVILVVLLSTAYFFWKVITLTLRKSKDTGGLLGLIAKKSMRFSSAPVKIAPRPKLDWNLTVQAVEHERRETRARSIEETSKMHKERLMIRIKSLEPTAIHG